MHIGDNVSSGNEEEESAGTPHPEQAAGGEEGAGVWAAQESPLALSAGRVLKVQRPEYECMICLQMTTSGELGWGA